MPRFSRTVLLAVLFLSGCTTVSESEQSADSESALAASIEAPPNHPGVRPASARSRKAALPRTNSALELYKQTVAQHIVQNSDDHFEGQLPPILRSVVVLNVTVDREGRAMQVKVHRSNGIKSLERVAIESVQRAGKLPVPSNAVIKGDGNLSYMETFLFRNDGKFQIRSLVTEPQPGAEALATASAR